MPDFVLQDDQNVDCAVQIYDDAANIVPGQTLDAGSLTCEVALADGSDASATLAVTVDPSQDKVNVRALGPEATGIVVTPAATLAGAPLKGVPIEFDVTASPAVGVGLVPGTPVHN